MKPIKWQLKWGIAMIFLLSSFVVPAALAEELSAKEVMMKVDDRETGETAIQESTMILIDRKGRQRVRQTKSFSKVFGDDTKNITF